MHEVNKTHDQYRKYIEIPTIKGYNLTEPCFPGQFKEPSSLLKGWSCPKCGRTLSPYIDVCPCSFGVTFVKSENVETSKLEVKKLEWNDLTTSLEKERGLFEIKSGIREFKMYYYIRNFKSLDSIDKGKFYLICGESKLVLEYDSLEYAKQKAQEYFEETIYQIFFQLNGVC